VLVRAVETSNQETIPEIEAHIEREWDALLARAEEQGKRIWNGVTQRVNELEVRDGQLHVEFAPLDFKHRECVVSYPGYFELAESYWRKGAWVGALVETSDDWYVHARLSGRSNTTKKENILGGIVGDETPARSGKDLFNEMYRELEEESAVPSSAVDRMALELVYLSPSTNVGFVFSVQLTDTRAALEQRFAASEKDPDIAGLVFTKPEDLAPTLRALGPSAAYIADTFEL